MLPLLLLLLLLLFGHTYKKNEKYTQPKELIY